MLKSHSTIFLKPDNGSGGSGILKIRNTSTHDYEIRQGETRKRVGQHTLYRTLKKYQKSPKKYIVQRGIHLGKYHGRVFDIRMYLQKPQSEWGISGMVARIAPKHRYITNYHKGGQAATLDKVLLPLFEDNTEKVNDCIEKLRTISLTIADTLTKQFPDTREFGIDLAVDSNRRIWIIEANTRPQHNLFTKLSNKEMLYTIRHNKKLIKKG
ncbi:glutathione synthase/RimK-type ligase-like ATP-grasp enzyme [Paenibacillus sp. DS2015]